MFDCFCFCTGPVPNGRRYREGSGLGFEVFGGLNVFRDFSGLVFLGSGTRIRTLAQKLSVRSPGLGLGGNCPEKVPKP